MLETVLNIVESIIGIVLIVMFARYINLGRRIQRQNEAYYAEHLGKMDRAWDELDTLQAEAEKLEEQERRMKRVYICSPYRGDTRQNTVNARQYCHEAIQQGYIPIAPHLYFTQLLDDRNPEQRQMGLSMGLQLLEDCESVWVYGEPSEGMRDEIEHAERLGIRIIWKYSPGGEEGKNEVIEVCPHCMNECEYQMTDSEIAHSDGKASCTHCGEPILTCSECRRQKCERQPDCFEKQSAEV